MNRLTLIEAFLRPSPFMYDHSAWAVMLDAFASVPEQERAEFHAAAKVMKYSRYSRTVYWGVIRGWMVHLHPRCQNCGANRGLQIHHAVYDHRGQEHLFTGDLRVICSLCHKGAHGLATAADLVKTRERRLNAWKFAVDQEQPDLDRMGSYNAIAEGVRRNNHDAEMLEMVGVGKTIEQVEADLRRSEIAYKYNELRSTTRVTTAIAADNQILRAISGDRR